MRGVRKHIYRGGLDGSKRSPLQLVLLRHFWWTTKPALEAREEGGDEEEVREHSYVCTRANTVVATSQPQHAFFPLLPPNKQRRWQQGTLTQPRP